MTALGDGIEQIMLNAIRYRVSLDESDSMVSSDRAWLLRYIDRLEDRLSTDQPPLLPSKKVS